ncbi:hypothetical protein Tco_1384140 [Tanacetum coccineum]
MTRRLDFSNDFSIHPVRQFQLNWFTQILYARLSAVETFCNENMILKDGGEVKEFQRSFLHSDTERLSRSDEVLKLKNLKKDALLKLFKFTYQEMYEHVGPEVTSSQDGKPTVEEYGVIRTKKYAELSTAEKIQVDCDMKATNIILQGLPADIYSLVNHHKVDKDLWERFQLLMQGTSLTK